MKQMKNKKLHTVQVSELHNVTICKYNPICPATPLASNNWHRDTRAKLVWPRRRISAGGITEASDKLSKAGEVLKLKIPSQDSLKTAVRIYFYRRNPWTACSAINYNRLSELNDGSLQTAVTNVEISFGGGTMGFWGPSTEWRFSDTCAETRL
jgi:hypothetical protein